MTSKNDLDSDSTSGSDDDYIEEPYVDTSLEGLCLFCDQIEINGDGLLLHLKNVHSVDLKDICSTNHVDSILYIKLINFIRSCKVEPAQLKEILSKDDWKEDVYMKPVKENDLLLTLDMADDSDDDADINCSGLVQNLPKVDVQQQAMFLEEYKKMRSLIFDLSQIDEPRSSHHDLDSDNYFHSYSHHSIHWEMLSDRPRTEAYRQAIDSNTNNFLGSTVLDIGCGTGILSLFACKSGAAKVVAVDQSEIIYSAMDIARENGYEDSIVFKKGKLEDLELNEKFDIIVSEWMGYFLLFEGMLDTVIKARDKYLKPGGLMLPGSCTLYMAALSNEQIYNERINFWNDVYGFKMTSMKKDVLSEVLVKDVNSQSVISDVFEIKTFDIGTCTIEEAQAVHNSFQLRMTSSGAVHGLVFWFDCYFTVDKKSPISLSTSPHAEATHWKQSILLLKEPIQLNSGELLTGEIKINRSCDDFRSLQILLTIDGKGSQKFIMN